MVRYPIKGWRLPVVDSVIASQASSRNVCWAASWQKPAKLNVLHFVDVGNLALPYTAPTIVYAVLWCKSFTIDPRYHIKLP